MPRQPLRQFMNWTKQGLEKLFRYTPMGVARENTDRTIAAQKQLAEYQYSKDLEMWNLGNQYNSPLSQMDRLRDAGLNPNLVYGSGGAAGNSAGQLPKYNAPNVQYGYQPLSFPDVLSRFQDFSMRNAQVDNVRAQTESLRKFRNPLMDEQRLLTTTKQGHEATKAGTSYLQQEQMKRLMPYQLESLKGSVALQQRRTENVMADTLFKEYRNDWKRIGVESSDNIAVRMLTRAWYESGAPMPSLRKYPGKGK